tara:strand:+ start:210 stop:731 length:522 start_codon:yes stop_codon:yes gene_type:complete
MSITVRVPDPNEEYNVGNQRQIVRAVNDVINQINAQYKPEGDTFSEIEQLSYFLGYAPSTSSGPEIRAGGVIYENIAVVSGQTVTVTRDNQGYVLPDMSSFADSVVFNLPVPSKTGFKVAFLCTTGFTGIIIDPGTKKINGFTGTIPINPAEGKTLVWDSVSQSWWTISSGPI